MRRNRSADGSWLRGCIPATASTKVVSALRPACLPKADWLLLRCEQAIPRRFVAADPKLHSPRLRWNRRIIHHTVLRPDARKQTTKKRAISNSSMSCAEMKRCDRDALEGCWQRIPGLRLFLTGHGGD
jgi:hypothetical protein